MVTTEQTDQFKAVDMALLELDGQSAKMFFELTKLSPEQQAEAVSRLRSTAEGVLAKLVDLEGMLSPATKPPADITITGAMRAAGYKAYGATLYQSSPAPPERGWGGNAADIYTRMEQVRRAEAGT